MDDATCDIVTVVEQEAAAAAVVVVAAPPAMVVDVALLPVGASDLFNAASRFASVVVC